MEGFVGAVVVVVAVFVFAFIRGASLQDDVLGTDDFNDRE